MAKALFLSLPLHGHTNPSLPLVRALADRGEDITYVSTDPFAEKVSQTGARFRPYRNSYLADLAGLPERTEEISWLLMRTVGEVLAQELDGFRAERPDYVIADSVAPWGQWIAQALNVPVVTSVTTLAFNRQVLTLGAARGTRPKSLRLMLSKIRHVTKASRLGRQLRRQYRINGTGIMGLVVGHSDLNIVYTSRVFQPCADTFDERYVFIGPSMASRTETVDVPLDITAARHLVYVSLGTLFNADPTFYRNCFEAFRDEPVHVLMSIGTAISAASLGPPPPNIVVRPYVPQLEVLRRASVFVSHGGMNSVSESLYHGVPMVVVPQMGEQQIVAQQVDALGAGLYVAKSNATADRLRGAVRRVLGEETFRRQAALVRQSFETAGGPARGADAILAFVKPRTVPAATVA